MSAKETLINRDLNVINVGLESFHQALHRQGVPSVNVDWRPPSPAVPHLAELDHSLIDEVNDDAVQRIIDSQPVLVDVARAADVIPGMKKNLILHAGPPIRWERMCGPVRGAVIGAILYEGLAGNPEEARELAESGEIEFSPCHHHAAVGPMAGIVSSSMYVWVVRNELFDNQAFCTLNEGLGKVLRFGAFSPEVIERLRWMESTLGPALKQVVGNSQGINVKNLTAQAMQMGDECHNRNVAATTLLLRELLPLLLDSDLDKETIRQVTDFITGNVHFFLNLSMAACKASTDVIHGLPHCSLLSTMARNGTEIGIRVAGLGDRWFTAPAGMPIGLFFAGFSQEDANPDLGDSTVSEVAGIGGFAMACAPAIVRFVGGSPEDAIRYTQEMYDICWARHTSFKIPILDFVGTPLGVDVRKVVETSMTPFINTGIAHREPGVGQVGAGLLRAPIEMFEAAARAMARAAGRRK